MESSRHPKINYWFFTEKTFENRAYLQTLERIAASSRFDTLALTDRGCDFWDPSHKEDFRALVTRAHTLGLKIVLQLWPKGSEFSTSHVSKEEAGASTVDVETLVKDGRAVIRSINKWNRCWQTCASLYSEFLRAYAFKKTASGYYEPNSLIDVTERIRIVHQTPDRVSATLDLPEYEGYTVFALAAHYNRIADVFSDRMLNDYREMMHCYADIPFDGFALDEFRGVTSLAPWMLTDAYRGRIYGVSFARIFKEKTGKDLIRILFDMRYCPDGCDSIRASAINTYFDVYRRGVLRTEDLVYDLTKVLYGENAFVGFHNTYHNSLINDEMWNTGCAWWEVKRDYAQTDENMIFPVRLALACQSKNTIHYDMYYNLEKEKFFEKCMHDAAYGGRIHYHAIDDGSKWGLDTGNTAFLAEVAQYEDAVELLNLFDPAMPSLSLLIVFGFPALCNWYPDESTRGKFDLNESLGIMEKAGALWNEGYLNALAPDDALIDGRITLDSDGHFDYCGHKFSAMLFMHPEYAKREVVSFLKNAIAKHANIKVIGKLVYGFDGQKTDGSFLDNCTVDYEFDPERELGLLKNDIPDGCRLADGSVVLSHYESLRDGVPHAANFTIGEERYEVSFLGTFAIRTDTDGNIMKLACADLRELLKNGAPALPQLRGKNIFFTKA